MSTDLPDTGTFTVNDRPATRIHFRLERDPDGIRRITLRFRDDSQEIARATLDPQQARELLGERNMAALLRQADARPAAKTVTGRLQGRDLEGRDVLLPGHPPAPTDNAIALDSRQRDQPPRPTARPNPTHATPDPGHPTDENGTPPSVKPPAHPVPEAVAQRFIQVGNRYYFPDQTLAFTDQGTRLKSATNNTEVVRSLLTIAQARGWDAITVTGAEAFRRQVWQEATHRGIEVHGYEPTEVERAAAHQRLRAAAQDTTGDRQHAARPAHGGPPSSQPARAPHEQVSGRLLEAAAAHYRFDPSQRQSYYVKLRTADGERTLWGADLERALAESATQVRIGDHVTVEHRGASAVTVKVPKRDANGNLLGDEKLVTHRNAWLIEKPEYFARRQQAAQAFQHGNASRESLVREHPELTNAVVSLWLGEQFADQRLQHPDNRKRMVELVKQRLTQALEHGEPIEAPLLKREIAQRLDDLRSPPQRTSAPRSRQPAPERSVDERQHAR